MNRLVHLCCNTVFLMGMVFIVACGPQTDEETAGAEKTGQGNSTENGQAGKSNNSDEHYTSAKRNHERASSISESKEDMDVLTPEDPVMAYAHYHTVEFNEGVAELTDDAENDLRDFVSSLREHQPLYITIRMEDEDTLDVTEPTPEFKKLIATRVNQITDFFQSGDLEIAELKVDEPGITETPGEGRALARPENGEDKNEQLVVITIETEENGEPSDTIPHSPDVETMEG